MYKKYCWKPEEFIVLTVLDQPVKVFVRILFVCKVKIENYYRTTLAT
jgi:hypothetical protein